jgi:3-dehydroquinate synthase
MRSPSRESPPPPALINVPHHRGRYPVVFAPLDRLPAEMSDAGLKSGKCIVVTDENVAPVYLKSLTEPLEAAGWTTMPIVLPAGEETKSLSHLGTLYDHILPLEIDRRTPVIALGGGVTGDLAGFAAATLLRGLPLVQVPTTLIAQVDSAVGGKTGINHPAGKNLIGAFHPPHLVLTDAGTLATLPEREWVSGLAEVVKHALISEGELAGLLLDHWEAIMSREQATLARILPPAVQVKVDVVVEDEHETGRRAILNFGHTFGHAIERLSGYGTYTHGEAVAVGMRCALDLSKRVNPGADLAVATDLLQRLPIPPRRNTITAEALVAAMGVDKKRDAAGPRFVLLKRTGVAHLASADESLIRESWNTIQSEWM